MPLRKIAIMMRFADFICKNQIVIFVSRAKFKTMFGLLAPVFLELLQNREGKIVVKSVSGAERDIVGNNSDSTEYAEQSYIKVKGAQKANAFEVLITVAGKEREKNILEFSDQYSYKTFSLID